MPPATPERVEQIDIWFRMWADGIGLPKEIWNNQSVQWECLEGNDAAGALAALSTAAISLGCGNIMNDTKNKLECLLMFDKFQLKD